MNEIVKIKNGGNAVENVSQIDQKDIPKTLESFCKDILTPLNINIWELLGSALKKKEPSNDLDVAVFYDSDLDTVQSFCNKIETHLKTIDTAYNYMSGISIISISFPIPDSKKNVQIDIIPTDNMDFTRWMYWSPEYKDSTLTQRLGLYRTSFLREIAGAFSTTLETFEDGSPKIISRYSLNLTTGLSRKIETFEGAKGRLKIPKLLKRDDEFGFIRDSKKISELLLKATPDDLNSYESILNKLKKLSLNKETVNRIKGRYVVSLKRKKLPIPESLNELEGV